MVAGQAHSTSYQAFRDTTTIGNYYIRFSHTPCFRSSGLSILALKSFSTDSHPILHSSISASLSIPPKVLLCTLTLSPRQKTKVRCRRCHQITKGKVWDMLQVTKNFKWRREERELEWLVSVISLSFVKECLLTMLQDCLTMTTKESVDYQRYLGIFITG